MKKINIYTVLNSAYWKFGKIFIDSLYDKVNINNINKIYISNTGLEQSQILYLQSKPEVEIIDSNISTNFEGGTWSDEWHQVVTSKTKVLKDIIIRDDYPTVMIDADCLFLDDITNLIDTKYDLQICHRNHHIPYLGSFVSINNKSGIGFIDQWIQNIKSTAKIDKDGHLIARESPALSLTVKEMSGEFKIEDISEFIVSATHKDMLSDNTKIVHFKGSSKASDVSELYDKRLSKRPVLYNLAKKYLELNILFLCNREYYINKMSRVRFQSMEAIGYASNLMWWGPNWEGYDNNKTVKQNIDLLEDTFDLIITYKPLEMRDMKDAGIPICLRYNEMYDEKWTKKEIDESGASMVICHHENDMKPYLDFYNGKIEFYHIAHCAEASIYKQMFTAKKYDILLVGALGARTMLGQHYPLRDRMVGILNKMPSRYNTSIHPRPHGRQDNAWTNKYAKDFATAINNTRICITDSGAPNSRFGKYIEIPMCGTVIAGDIPGEDQKNFKKFIIEINMEMTDEEIINKLMYYLDNDEKLCILKNTGLEWSKEYTQEKYADKFLKAALDFIEKNNENN